MEKGYFVDWALTQRIWPFLPVLCMTNIWLQKFVNGDMLPTVPVVSYITQIYIITVIMRRNADCYVFNIKYSNVFEDEFPLKMNNKVIVMQRCNEYNFFLWPNLQDSIITYLNLDRLSWLCVSLHFLYCHYESIVFFSVSCKIRHNY